MSVTGLSREDSKLFVEHGWHGLVDKVYDELEKHSDLDLYVLDVKEKFGVLNISVSGITESLLCFIDKVEKESSTICEICGEPGSTRYDLSWYLTLCDKHYNERKK